MGSEDQDSVDANVVKAEVDNERLSDVISSSNEDILNEQDNGTFTALQEKINNADENATITLENDYTYDEGFSTDGITISKALTIDGKGYCLDANKLSRGFNVTACNVVLKNIVFKNGKSFDYGGAIYFSSSGTVENCSFVNSSSRGAVYFENFGTVTNCNFTDNTASYCGGAVYFSGSGTVKNCNFTNNKATGEDGVGGAVYVHSDGNITNCNFINNTARSGGAVYFRSSGTVTNCNL